MAITSDFAFAALKFEIWDLDGFGNDQVTLSNDNSSFIIDGVTGLISNNVASWVANAIFTTVDSDGAINITANSPVNGGFYIGGITAVPLPAAAWLFLSVLGGAGVMRKFGKQGA